MPFGDDAVLTATVDDNHVDIVLTATGMLTATVYRIQLSKPELIVRGAKDTGVFGPDLWTGSDFEAPAAVPLSYRATINDGVGDFEVVAVAMTNGTVDFGGDHLAPVGRPNIAMVVNVEKGGLGELTRDVIRDVQPVLNRPSPVAISYGRRFWQADVTFLTLSDVEREDFLRLLDFPVLFFAPRPGFGFPDPVFVSVGQAVEARTAGLGSEPSRRITVSLSEVDRPPPDYPYTIIGDTWQFWLDSTDTWQDAFDTRDNWYQLAGYP